MPLDLASLVAPGRTALVTQECQRGVVGDRSGLPELAAAARGEVLANIARLVVGARDAGVPVLHCTVVQRADGFGANRNSRLFQALAKRGPRLEPGSEVAQIVPEIPVADSDVVLSRLHGLSPFQGTELDFLLRNQRIETIVAVGVSVNVAITNFTFDAVNASYQVVIPRDAVAGFPREYVEAVFRNTLGAVATLTDAASLLACWKR